MSTETLLYDLANTVRNLLDCDAVGLFLDCPEPVLRHPLLNLCSLHDRFLSYDALLRVFALPADERIWAVCDMAMQTGTIWGIDHLHYQNSSTGSMAAVPLKRATGLLGLLILIDIRPDAFQYGEYRLLEQHLPAMVLHIEAMLGERCLHPPVTTGEDRASYEIQEQSEFISMVSHELRAPLAAIKGYAGLLYTYGRTNYSANYQEGNLAVEMTEDRQQHYLSRIMEQTKHLEVLISDLLDVSRIQAGHLTLRRSPVDLVPVCQNVAQLLQYRVDVQQPGYYTIRCHVDAQLPMAWADPDRVQQVLTNLVENAVKYSPHGGLIEILAYTRRLLCPVDLCPISEEGYGYAALKRGASYIRNTLKIYITVRDWGIGISPQQQSTLFKPFTRLEHPATNHVQGLGLGLYISRKLVEAMDGCLMLKSHEGRGTSVTFTLPTGRA